MHIGETPHDGALFVKVEVKNGKASFTGVVGPKANGNARGGCGQVIVDFQEYDKRGHLSISDIHPAAGWDRDSIKSLFDLWDRWHLNDMHAGCEHQRAEGWGKEELEVVTYALISPAWSERNRIRERLILAAGERVDLNKREKALLRAPLETHQPPDADSPLSGEYEVKKRETISSNRVRQDEHPRGVLCKACPVCGWKYGEGWKFEPLPTEFEKWIEEFPSGTKTPAWI